MRNTPLVYTGRAVKKTKATPAGANKTKTSEHPAAQDFTEQKDDLLIRDLWQLGTNSVHNMRFVNTDALTYQLNAPEKCLHQA